MNNVKPTSEDLRRLITQGACAIPILGKEKLASLSEEAMRSEFKQRESRTKTGVIQNFSGCDWFEPESTFLTLAHETATMLNRIFDHMVCKPIEFNDHSLQLYPVSKDDEECAISPHLDHKNCINLIAVYVLKGRAPFYICQDRTGAHAVEVYSKPGDLILMRGTGFLGSDFRPFHFVGKVSEERLTFGLRQTTDKKELVKQYK